MNFNELKKSWFYRFTLKIQGVIHFTTYDHEDFKSYVTYIALRAYMFINKNFEIYDEMFKPRTIMLFL